MFSLLTVGHRGFGSGAAGWRCWSTVFAAAVVIAAGCSSPPADDVVTGPARSAADVVTSPTVAADDGVTGPARAADDGVVGEAVPPTVSAGGAEFTEVTEPTTSTTTSAVSTTVAVDPDAPAEQSTTSATSGPPPTAAQEPPAVPPADAILAVDFQSSTPGPYTDAVIRAEWPGIRYTKVGDRASIVDDGGNRFVRIRFPNAKVGNDEAGSLWQVDLDGDAADELYVAYRVRFVGSGFDFVKGGKLPGLSGGEDNTGGERPTGNDGWSGRMMWRGGGEAVQYLYHPDQPGTYGEDLDWGVRFAPDRWATVETRISMNTPGRSDGIVEAWFDGRKVLSRNDIRFRDTDAFNIDSFLFHTFFGGSGADWAPTKDEVIDFDDVVISRSPITH